MSEMRTATEIKKLESFTGDARLFKLSEPIPWDYDWETNQNKSSASFVVVSATIAMYSGPETYIFPADEEGEIISWSELDGSYRGGLDHAQALRGAGYEVAQ